MGRKDEKLNGYFSIEMTGGSSSRNVTDHPDGITYLPRWPSEPQPLTDRPLVHWGLNTYDIVLCIIPLVLMAKTILVCITHRLDFQQIIIMTDIRLYGIGELSHFIGRFNSQLATAFTILFVTTMTTLVRRLALWRAQKGATVAELEQLQSSISLPSTIKLVWSLRAFTLTSVALVSTWCFYYLGSQASLREFTLQDSERFRDIPAIYWNSDAPSIFQPERMSKYPKVLEITTNATGVMLSQLNAQFTTAVVNAYSYDGNANSQKNGYDWTEAPLIPWFGSNLDSGPASTWFAPTKPDRRGWQDTVDSSSNLYSSYAGSPMWVVDQAGNTALTGSYLGKYLLNTSYIVANCSTPEVVKPRMFPDTLNSLTTSLNITNSTAPGADGVILRQFEIWDRTRNKDSPSHAFCNLSTEYVEAEVECKSHGCATTRVRHRIDTSLDRARTPFDSDEFASTFFSNLMLSTGIPSSSEDRTVLENFQYNGLSPFLAEVKSGAIVSDPVGPLHQLSTCISALINTYYTLSQTIVFDNSNIGPDIIGNQVLGRDSRFISTTMHGAYYNPHYVISPAWIAVDFLSCNILFVAALASFYLRRRTLAPDIFGYVSSLTRDNPNLSLPDGGSMLDGLERARLLKHVRVKIADVGGSGGAGRVGLVRADAELPLDELQRNRVYA